MISDHFQKKWNKEWEKQPWFPKPPYDQPKPPPATIPNPEYEKWIKKIQEEAKIAEDLLKKAAEYDKINKQPDCELEEKKRALLDLAKLLGIQIQFPDKENNDEVTQNT